MEYDEMGSIYVTGGGDRINPTPGLLGRADSARCIHLDREPRVSGDARRDDLVRRAAATLVERPAQPIE